MNKPELADTRKALERVDQLEALVRKISNEADALVKGFSDEADDRITPLLEALERISRLHPADCVSVKAMLAPPVQQEPKCSDHPDAPHGFDRDASHTAGRYVCDCEGWVPPEKPDHGCDCRWDKDDNRIVTCALHQSWLDVISEWAELAKVAEAAPDHTALLRQALEGFESLQRQYKEDPGIYMDWSKAREAIKAIREALK